MDKGKITCEAAQTFIYKATAQIKKSWLTKPALFMMQ